MKIKIPGFEPSKNIEERKNRLFIVLSGIFITNAILAEIIGVKIFSAESIIGMAPANIHIFGDQALGFNLTAGAVIWPVVFITTDIINEYFGQKGVKRISYLTALFIAYVFIAIYLVTMLPPADFWLEVNNKDQDGNPFNISFAFSKLFRQGLGIIVGSLTAFIIGQLLDVFIFHKLRKITGSKMIWLRATGSTLVSQLIDSFVVIFIAFYLLAPADTRWNFAQLMNVGTMNYIYKFSVAILLTPLLYLAHYWIDNYLGKDNAEKITDEAMQSDGFF
jgi:queuosine precursor transporter